MTYPDGREINYDYSHGTDAAIDEVMSRLSAIYDDADDDGDIDAGEDVYASYRYLGADSIVRENYEEIQVDLDYTGSNFAAIDRFGRAAEQIWNDYGASSVLDHYTYSYDRVGNLDERDNELHAAFDLDYDYDGLYRLTDAERADDVDQSWDLDATGNWSSFDDDGTSQTRDVNEANEIETITGGWITPEYDAAGNMKSGPKPGDETTRIHYVYDAWNRLVEVRADNSGSPGALIAEYTYDALNRRVEKAVTSGSVHTHYFYSGAWQCVEERVEASGQLPADADVQYVWGARYIDNLILRDRDADANAGNGLEERLYALQDAHFDVTALFDASTGAVVERFVYDAYGNVTELDPDDFTTYTGTDYDWEYTYTTRREDAETGLMYYRNRYYQAGLGRFISRDPISYFSGSLNLYSYCASAPVIAADPTGLAVVVIDLVPENDPQGSFKGDIWTEPDAAAKLKALEKFLEGLSDKDFENIRDLGKVTHDGERMGVDVTREKYLDLIAQELAQSYEVHVRQGGYKWTTILLNDVARGMNAGDIVVLSVHGLRDKKTGKLLGTMRFNDDVVEKAVVNGMMVDLARTYSDLKFVIVSCFNNPEKWEEDGEIDCSAYYVGKVGGRSGKRLPQTWRIGFTPFTYVRFKKDPIRKVWVPVPRNKMFVDEGLIDDPTKKECP